MNFRRRLRAIWLAIFFAMVPSAFAEIDGVEVEGAFKGRMVFSMEKDGRSQLVAADLEGKKIVEVVQGPGNSTYPAPSPDGTTLAFVSDRDGNEEIYLSSWDGTNPQRLTNTPTPELHPAWGRNFIYYTGIQGKGNDAIQNIFSISPSGGTPTVVTSFPGKNYSPSLSLKGDLLAFTTDRFWPGTDICLFDMKSKKENCLLSGTRAFLRPRVSPAGDKLSYTFGDKANYDVGFVDIKTRKQKTVSNQGVKEYDTAWSEDGKELAFISEEGGEYLINVLSLDEEVDETAVRSPYPIKHLAWAGRSQKELETKRLNEEDPVLKVVPMPQKPNFTPPYLAD